MLCRSVKASHVLISADGQVCMSGLRSIFSLIRHGQRARVVHDFPQYSVKVLPWLSPEVLQQVGYRLCPCSASFENAVQRKQFSVLHLSQLNGSRSKMWMKLTVNFIFDCLLSEPAGLRLSVRHLQPWHHSL